MFDHREVFRIPFKMLKTYGLWQTKESSWSYRVYGFIIHIMFIDFFTFFQFLYIFYAEDVQELSDWLSVFLTNVAQSFKTYNFLFKLSSIIVIVDNLEKLIKLAENYESRNHEKLRRFVNEGHRSFVLFCGSAVLTCALAALVPIFNFKERTLAYKMAFPFLDYKRDDLTFALVAIYEMAPICSCCIDISLDMLPVFCFCFATGLIEELSDRLKNIAKNKSVRIVRETPSNGDSEDLQELLKCIEIHKGIKGFVDETRELFSTIVMVQGVMSSIILATLAFVLSQVNQQSQVSNIS